jgi:hypothetical protein
MKNELSYCHLSLLDGYAVCYIMLNKNKVEKQLPNISIYFHLLQVPQTPVPNAYRRPLGLFL